MRSRGTFFFGWICAAAGGVCFVPHAAADTLVWPSVALDALTSASLAQLESDPEAIFSMSTEQPVINVAFSVDASRSYDRPNAAIPLSSYTWSWGDGTANSTGITAQHTYTKSGRFTLKLTVTDNESRSDTATRTIVIASTAPDPGDENRAPSASLFINPLEGFVDDGFTFDASGSRDPDGDPIVFRFNFGDGDETDFSSDAVVTHSYAQTGTFVVRLTVRDDQNASADISGTVRVISVDPNESPVAYIATGPRTGAAPVTLSFDGRVSYDPDDDPLSYEWSFYLGDALYATQSGSVVNQLFSVPGSYSVVLEVSDPDGATGTSDEQIITITEGAEPVEPPPPAPIPEPEDPPPSYTQRPPAVCGVGMLLPMVGCLLGIVTGRLVRRRD